jgi:hypothetical protein
MKNTRSTTSVVAERCLTIRAQILEECFGYSEQQQQHQKKKKKMDFFGAMRRPAHEEFASRGSMQMKLWLQGCSVCACPKAPSVKPAGLSRTRSAPSVKLAALSRTGLARV